MKTVIDIPEAVREYIIDCGTIDSCYNAFITNAIANGTSLSEALGKVKEELENNIHHFSPEARSSMDHASNCINEAKNRGIELALDIINKHLGEVEK